MKETEREREREREYHPTKALSSLVRFNDKEKGTSCIYFPEECEAGFAKSSIHQFIFFIRLLFELSSSLWHMTYSSNRSSYIDTTDSKYWVNHQFSAT
jgi:hypothetical protein